MRPAPHWCAAVFAAALVAGLRAQTPTPTASRSVAVRCGTLLLGDGSPPRTDVWLVIQDGVVASIGAEEPAAALPRVDARGKVVMPGIVAVDGDFGTAADSDYQVTPDAMAVDGFDFERKWLAAWQGGVTTAYLSPGRNRLVSGQGAVVKLAGTDLVTRILSEATCLRLNLGDAALNAPRVFEPVPHPTDETPLEPARIQLPTARIGALAELRARFAAATDQDRRPNGQGSAENRYDEQALAAVVGGKLPLRIAAAKAQDIRAALQLQSELGCRMVLEDPLFLAPLANTAAQQKVGATFRLPIRFGQPTGGGEDRQQPNWLWPLDGPAAAAKAGMLVGIAPAAGSSPRDTLLAAAAAVGHGLPRERALRALGSDAAALLGVDARVGTLAKGKDGDFVVLSGDPLAVGTMVEATWIEGHNVWSRNTKSQALAVRCGRILDGEGRTFRSGVILVQNGRIQGIGEELAIPYGATVLDLPGAVMTPGFVDSWSHLGLAGDGQGVPPGQANQRLHEAVAHDDPMFAPALTAGLTTVLVSGKDGGGSARVAALKTGAADPAGMVVQPIAGLRVQHEAIGPDALKPLRDQFERGKQYLEQWRKYDKDLAEWQGGKKPAAPAPEPAKVEPKPDAKPAEDPLSGTWVAELDIQGRLQLKLTFELRLDGTKVTGNVTLALMGRDTPPRDIENGTFENGVLTVEFRGQQGTSSKFEAKLEGDTLVGKFGLGPAGTQEVVAKRTAKAQGGAAAPSPRRSDSKPSEDGRPKPPKLDEALEPWRAVLEKRAALVVRCNRGPALAEVIAWLEQEQIPYVLQGAEDLLDDAGLAKGKKPAVLVGPEVVVENDGELLNTAATFADRDQPVLFGSGECAPARFLPLHAAYAVRYGLSPADALAALTLWPARAFRLDDRIGSLRKGKDADFVVFSGDPFEPQSRVLLVVCNGRVVVDQSATREDKQ